MTKSLRDMIFVKEEYDVEPLACLVTARLRADVAIGISTADMLIDEDAILRARLRTEQAIVSAVYEPVEKIVLEALDEVHTADVWKRNDPYFNAHRAVEDLLLRILSKVRSL